MMALDSPFWNFSLADMWRIDRRLSKRDWKVPAAARRWGGPGEAGGIRMPSRTQNAQNLVTGEMRGFEIIGVSVWVGNGPFTVGGNTGGNLSLKGTGERIRWFSGCWVCYRHTTRRILRCSYIPQIFIKFLLCASHCPPGSLMDLAECSGLAVQIKESSLFNENWRRG